MVSRPMTSRVAGRVAKQVDVERVLNDNEEQKHG